MATQPTAPVVALHPAFPPARAARIASALLGRHSPHEIAEAITVLIDVLDLIGPGTDDDADFRPQSDGLPGEPDDAEPIGDDQGDVAWLEWHTRGRHKTEARSERIARVDGRPLHEDDEDDDPAEEDDPAGVADEDGFNTWGHGIRIALDNAGPGCPISDPDCDYFPGGF